MYGTDFSIWSCGQLRNRTKSKIIGFSKIARWNSLKINERSQFLIYFHLQLWKTSKSEVKIFGFFSTLHVQMGKNFKKSIFSNFDFRTFDILSWKSIKKWPRSLIFIEFHRAVFLKPIIFNFVRFLSWPRDEIQKSASYIFFSIPFSVGWTKPHDDIWHGQCAMLAESYGPPIKKSTLGVFFLSNFREFRDDLFDHPRTPSK